MDNEYAQVAAAPVEDRFAQARAVVAGRMPELDGLRGLAVLAVIWHNAGLTWDHHGAGMLHELLQLTANMGWMGVQLFFVLSGFLISGILLDQQGAPRQLRNFYMRRVLRILPLYFVVLAVLFVLLPALQLTPAWVHPRAQVWYWTFLVNWAEPIWHGDGGLGHFWSLAVEEQFYLLWPILTVSLARDTMARFCVGLIVTAISARALLEWYDPEFALDAAYQFTVARWDALAVGALLALVMRRREWFERLDAWAPWLSLMLLAYMAIDIARAHNFAPVAGGIAVAALNQTVAALLFGLLIFAALRPRAVASAMQARLRNAALRSVGKYSYAIYVFHLPMIHVWGYLAPRLPWLARLPPALQTLCDIGAVFVLSSALAWLSWQVLEQPCLQLKRFFANPKTA
jgi:peptidoglycan/LPS O-acetylase OafA/YrhL